MTEGKNSIYKDMLPAVFPVGGAWFFTTIQLQKQWSLNPQYAYGWLTIPLALYLLWRETEQTPANLKASSPNYGLELLGVICLLSYLPLWFIQESSPDWRLLNWLIFMPAVSITCIWYAYSGGILELKRLVFPLFFIATSIPWLLSWDLKLATLLQAKVSQFVQESLLLAGRYAEIEGNLIRLSNCTVGVDEACSGIRGLQSSFVVALFIGQYLRFSIILRLLLLLASVLFAFFLNLLRASFLAHLSASRGTDMASRWHDPIGILESVGTLVLLVLLVTLIIKFFNVSHALTIDDAKFGSFNFLKKPFPYRVSVFAAVWFPLVFLTTIFWFRFKEKSVPESPRIAVDFQSKSRIYNKQRISDAIKAQLNFKQAASGSWVSDEGQEFIGFYCRWEQGSGSPLALAVHTPEVCLQLRGYRLIRKQSDISITFPFSSIPVPFEAYTFSYQEQIVHIYRCYWPDRIMDGVYPGFPSQGYNTLGRLKAAARGYRNPGANMIAIGVFQNSLISNFDIATEVIANELRNKVFLRD